MQLHSVCLYTTDAPRLAAFYAAVLQEAPFQEGTHYTFARARIAVYDPGEAAAPAGRNAALILCVPDVDAAYARLCADAPGIVIESPPARRPWGAYSFRFADPDGNHVAVVLQPPA